MSALAISNQEYFEQEIIKVYQKKWNTDVIHWLAYELGFRLVKHNDLHYSLHQSKNKRLDYWPANGTGLWYYKNTSSGKPSKILDMEVYVLKHFKSDS